MVPMRDALTNLFFRGDRDLARCLFEGTRDDAALHVPGGAARNPLLSIDWLPYVSTLMDNRDVGPFEFDVIQRGAAGNTSAFLDAKSNPSAEAIGRALNQGATLRVMGVSRFEQNCGAQLQLLRQVLKREAFVNLYVTPAQCTGLKVHYDLEDSLVVQVKGEKHWKLFAPTTPRYPRELPLAPLEVSGEPAQLIHMRAGDVLFVPSGLPHTVETRESGSQHVTFGVHVSRSAALLGALMEEFAATQEELRQPIRSDENVSRVQLAEWAGRFQHWLAQTKD